jgi:hypothetical protein
MPKGNFQEVLVMNDFFIPFFVKDIADKALVANSNRVLLRRR